MTTSYEPGAPAPEGIIPLAVPEIRGNEWGYIKECLDTNWVSSVGPFVDRFERELAARVGVEHAIATVNGTAALHIALLVAGVEPGDEVLVPSLTFVAPVNAIRYVNAWPVFIDADPDFWQMDVEQVRSFVEQRCTWKGGQLRNRATGRPVKAILPVHVLGHPVDMDPLAEIAERFGLALIEDATEALGASYKGRQVGSLGHIACFSFNGNKIITTGGGGMIVTANEDWARKSRYLTTQAKDDPLEYIHHQIGYNYRLTNIQAAMGCAQLEQLDHHIQAKRAIAAKYAKDLQEIAGIRWMREASWASSIFWLFTVLIDAENYGKGSREVLQMLWQEGIATRPLWHPIHSLKPYQDCEALSMENTVRLYAQALSLPSSVGLSSEQQGQVVAALARR